MQRAWKILQKKGVMMLAVHVGGNSDDVWAFLSRFDVDFRVLMDRSSKVSRSWPVRGLPVSFIIDPQGRIALRAIGARKWDDPSLMDQILALKTLETKAGKPDSDNQQ